jgi:DNA-binding GntR family transcriptional regulator
VKYHGAILDALAKKDKTGAELALRPHLGGTLSFVKEIRTLYPEWVSV